MAKILPKTFGIVIDGWTESGTHFVAIYASFVDLSTDKLQVNYSNI